MAYHNPGSRETLKGGERNPALQNKESFCR
jgi:hypothetical protein